MQPQYNLHTLKKGITMNKQDIQIHSRVRFNAGKPLFAGKVYLVNYKGIRVSGRIMEADYMGNCIMEVLTVENA
jgi:hypothetical protein